MASPVPAPTKIRFDAFELDASTGELRKSGILLKLQPQPFRILLLLVERAGHLVTREEIQRCLWRDSTFVDFEHGINFSINQIRGALADNAEKPCYIETLPRRGYRFIGTVGQPPSVNITVLKRRQEALPEEAAPRRWLKPAHKKNMIVVACVPFLAVAFAAYHFWPRPSPPNSPAKITQISQWNKPMNNASLSPDGHAVAFVSPVSGIEQVFLMLTSGAEPLQLTNDEGDKEVDAFSSDGKEIYYVRSFGRDEVWAVPTLGGTPRRVVVSGRGVVPSSDGAFIYYKKSDSAGIFRAEKSGLNEELVYNSEDANRYFVPLLLFPGDSELLAAGVRQGSPNVRILRINLSSHETVDLGEIAVGGNGKRMGRTRENPAIHSYCKRADEHLEIQLAGPESDADYFRNGTGLHAHARPRRKRDLLCEWQILGVSNRVPRSIKGIQGDRVGGRDSAHHLAGREARNVHHAPRTPEVRTLGVGHRRWQ